MAPTKTPVPPSDSSLVHPPLFQEFPPQRTWLDWLQLPKEARSPKVLGGAVLLLALAVAAAALLWTFGRERVLTGAAAHADTAAAAAIAAERERAEQEVARAKSEAALREQIALARVKLLAARDSGRVVLKTLDRCGQEVAAWQAEVVPLLSNERGRRIAAKPEWVTLFGALSNQHRPELWEVDAARTRLGALLEPVERGLASATSTYEPADSLLAEIEQERLAAERFIDAYRAGRTSIAALVAQADREATPSKESLESALKELNNQHAEDRAKIVASESEKGREEADRRVAQAEAERRRQEAEDTAKKIEARKEADRLARGKPRLHEP